MMGPPNTFCKACMRCNIETQPIKLCIDCDEPLCENCANAHKINNLTVAHSVVTNDVVSKLPFKLENSVRPCPSHPDCQISCVCASHDDICCIKCVVCSHRMCDNILPIGPAAVIVKGASVKSDFRKEINQIRDSGHKLIDFGIKNKKKTQEQNEDILKDVENTKCTFTLKVNDVEQTISKDLLGKLQQNIDTIEKYKEAVNKLKDAALVYRQEMDFIKTHASENKAFLLVEKLKHDLQRDTSKMLEIIYRIQNAQMIYIDAVNYDVKTLGHVIVKNRSCPINYYQVTRALIQKTDYSEGGYGQMINHEHEQQQINPETENDDEDDDVASNMVYEDIEEVTKDIKRPKEPSYVISSEPHGYLSPKDVEFLSKIRSGKLSDVWKARLRKTEIVAVKVIKKENKLISPSRLSEIQHENILQLYGTYTDKRSTCLVFEFCPYQDLVTYLKSADGRKLHETELTSIAAQIARGMAYLESKQIVHSCLTAKKVMISENGEAKLAGLEYITEEKVVAIYDYQAANEDELDIKFDDVITVTGKEDDNWWKGVIDKRQGVFPVNYVGPPQQYINVDENLIKWYAPETIQTSVCTTKSNVWSFGIVMVEIFNNGMPPYEGIKNSNLLQKLNQNYRQPRSDNCPEALYILMSKCWAEYPGDRPSFDSLQKFIEDIVFGF